MLPVVPLWQCLWKGTASNGSMGEVFLGSKPYSRHIVGNWLSYSQVCSRGNWAGKPWRGIPRPFQALSQMVLPGNEPATPTSRVGEILKSYRSCGSASLFDRVQMQEILHLSGTASPTSALFSKVGLPYSCNTGYATKPLLGYDLDECLMIELNTYRWHTHSLTLEKWLLLSIIDADQICPRCSLAYGSGTGPA